MFDEKNKLKKIFAKVLLEIIHRFVSLKLNMTLIPQVDKRNLVLSLKVKLEWKKILLTLKCNNEFDR